MASVSSSPEWLTSPYMFFWDWTGWFLAAVGVVLSAQTRANGHRLRRLVQGVQSDLQRRRLPSIPLILTLTILFFIFAWQFAVGLALALGVGHQPLVERVAGVCALLVTFALSVPWFALPLCGHSLVQTVLGSAFRNLRSLARTLETASYYRAVWGLIWEGMIKIVPIFAGIWRGVSAVVGA